MHPKTDFILLIDDDEATRFLHRIIADEAGVTENILEADGAERGLMMLEKMKTENPNARGLIFLDINMPVMNGWEFLEKLQSDDRFQLQAVHLYMVSSSEYPKDLERIKNEPLICGYVPKPLNVEKVLEAAEKLP